MPYKTFAVNEILTAADVNEYLMDQAVMSFAGTAARGSAIAAPSEGMVSYLDDSNQLEVYDGSNWVGLAGASVGTATPATTAEGDFWLDTDPADGQVLKAYNSGWKNVGPVSNNAIINGDFGVWQRGTSFSAQAYTADRWFAFASGSTFTATRESFTAGDIEAIGYGNAEFFYRFDVTTGNDFSSIFQRIEDVATFSGQKATLSFWAKGVNPGGGNLTVRYLQNFGSGGSSEVSGSYEPFTVTGSWQRFSVTFDIPSVAGKTIGAGNNILVQFGQGTDTSTDAWTLDIWGVQLEAGSVATPFRLAGGGSKAAELALCQRYYFRLAGENDITPFGVGLVSSTSRGNVVISYPVKMRSAPSISTPDATNLSVRDSGLGPETLSTFGVNPVRNSTRAAQADCNTSTSNLVAGNATILDGNTDAIIDFDAEL